MQYTTNYVFSKMNVSYALALFQLSTIFSVLLGVNIFKEKELLKKILASLIMILGAVLIILKNF
jgi:drug/metabolite transporter (DMT)-like permease